MNALTQMKSRGFTLLEMLVTITVVAVVAALVAPMFSDDNRLHLMAGSSVLASDIELAQVMTISFPDRAVVVRFDPTTQTYWLAYSTDPETPLNRTDTGEPYLVTLGQGRALSAQGVQMTPVQVANNMLEFNAQGGLVDFTATPSIQLTRGGSKIILAIAASTGTISETGG